MKTRCAAEVAVVLRMWREPYWNRQAVKEVVSEESSDAVAEVLEWERIVGSNRRTKWKILRVILEDGVGDSFARAVVEYDRELPCWKKW